MVVKRIQLVFSIISVLLMVPMIYVFDKGANSFSNFYRTLFVFYIDEVVEMFADDEKSINDVFAIWELLNRWLGAIVCAISFCMIIEGFEKLLFGLSCALQIFMLAIVISGLICSIAKDIVSTYNQKTAKDGIRKQMKS